MDREAWIIKDGQLISTEPNGWTKRQMFANQWELRKVTEELEHQKAREPISVFTTTATTATAFRSHFLCRLHHRMFEERDVRKLRFI